MKNATYDIDGFKVQQNVVWNKTTKLFKRKVAETCG